MSGAYKARDVNLDFLRALALIGVTTYHLQGMWPRPPQGRYLEFVQWGLDMFFVLSGWLIGGILLKEQKDFGNVEIFRFLSRRWLRTIPTYLTALPVAWLAVYVTRQEPFDWRYIFFLQNYIVKMPFFQLSWSLCIEEHFYLVLPFALVLIQYLRLSVPICLVLLSIIPCVLRNMTTMEDWNRPFGYYQTATHFRYEEITCGVLCAWTALHRPELWLKFQVLCRWLLWPSVLLIYWMGWWPVWAVKNIGYTALGFIFSVWLGAVAGRPPVPFAKTWIIKQLAKWSYSIYLLHTLVLHVCKIIYAKVPWVPGPIMLVFWIVSILAVGWILCTIVEQPSIRWRDKLMPDRFYLLKLKQQKELAVAQPAPQPVT